MKFTCLFLLYIGLLPSLCFGAECTRIDNGTNLGPARNQDSIGWCYAFASAELLTHRMGRRISPVDIAIGANFLRPDTYTERVRQYLHGTALPLEGGEVRQAINDIQTTTEGFCPDEEMPEGPHLRSSLKEVIHRHRCLNGDEAECEKLKDEPLSLAPLLPLSQADAYLQGPVTPAVWRKLATGTCRHRLKLPEGGRAIQESGSNRPSREHLLDVVDQELEKGNILAMQYDQLQIDTFPWWAQINVAVDKIAGSLARSMGLPDDPSHAVAIVGRRYNPELQTCQYEIRDSDNFQCKYGDASICDPDNRIWYTREDITRHIHDLIYLSE